MEAEVNLCFDQFVYKLSEQVGARHIFNPRLNANAYVEQKVQKVVDGIT